MKAQQAHHVRRQRNPGRWRAVTAMSVVALVLVTAQSSPAFASAPVERDVSGEGDPTFAEAVAALDSDDWRERIEAAEYLRHASVLNEEIETLIDAPSTTPEQRHQLLSILKLRVLERAAGAIGIQMSTARMRNNMIVVDRLFTNMPAEKVLKPGDRITHINGRPILIVSEFRNELRRLVPGDVVALEVERVRSPGERDQDGKPDEPDILPEGWNDVPREHPPSEVEILKLEIELGVAKSLGDDHMDDVWRERLEEVRVLSTRHKRQSVPLIAADWRSHVDSHRIIQDLMRQVRIYDGLPLNERRILADSWKRIDQQLRLGAIEGGLSSEERAFRRDILNRFRELLPVGATRNW